jgi:hypothetical protein
MFSKSIDGSRELRAVSGNPGKGAGADASDGKQGAIEAFIGDIVSIHHLREQAALVWAGIWRGCGDGGRRCAALTA